MPGGIKKRDAEHRQEHEDRIWAGFLGHGHMQRANRQQHRSNDSSDRDAAVNARDTADASEVVA